MSQCRCLCYAVKATDNELEDSMMETPVTEIRVSAAPPVRFLENRKLCLVQASREEDRCSSIGCEGQEGSRPPLHCNTPPQALQSNVEETPLLADPLKLDVSVNYGAGRLTSQGYERTICKLDTYKKKEEEEEEDEEKNEQRDEMEMHAVLMCGIEMTLSSLTASEHRKCLHHESFKQKVSNRRLQPSLEEKIPGD
ncbi:Speedy Protein E1 [Manis pentadactyla]|nr:Speedy Protein E1 [Manis pentadactyla]